MLSHKRNEAHEKGDGLRAEFEVRVIGGARQAPALDDGKGVEIGLRIGGSQAQTETGKVASSPVHRLSAEDAAEPLRARPLSEAVNEVGPAAPYVPRQRRKKGKSLTAWTVWMGAGTCTLAVAAVAGVMSAKKQQQESLAMVFAPQTTFGEERAYFLENTAALIREAETLLDQYAAAKSADEVLPLVRDAERVKDRLQALWSPMGAPSQTLPLEPVISDNEVRPALFLKGTKGDFTPFNIVFVRESGHLKIDWEASFAIGDAPLAELQKSKTVGKGAKVRVVVQPSSYYTPQFPESDYRSYFLLEANGEDGVRAFVRRSSRSAQLLEEEFNEGSILLDKSNEIPATLRISGPLPGGGNLFEITEMLHKGWVSP